MSNVWLYLVIFVFSVQSFSYSYCYFGIARSVMALSHSYVEEHIEYLDDETHPYFRSATLEIAIESYLSNALQHYCNRYYLGFFYYDPSNNTVCTSDCQAVRIDIKVELIPFEDYTQSLQFVIVKNYESTIT